MSVTSTQNGTFCFVEETKPQESPLSLTSDGNRSKLSLGQHNLLSFLTYLCEHQARLAHNLAGLKNGLQAIGSS